MGIDVHVELRARDTVKAVERGDIIAIIDVLRCSSTIVTALANGASEIIPVPTVKKAKQMKQRHPDYILAGERKGLKPKGFELGNSPRDFSHERIDEKVIILTTTDGTKAIESAKGATHVLIGSFLNASAGGRRLYEIARKKNCGISLIACGKKGRISIEDFLCAGKILETLPTDEYVLSDSALAALLASKGTGKRISELVRSGEHSKALEEIGLVEDVELCLGVDHYSIVPVFLNGKITL
jgi:2-phosphosulfolactate phosphatase